MKDSEFAYWTGFFFIATQSFIAANLVLFSVIVWYLMANCVWRYEVLGQQISKMGETDERSMTDAERDYVYSRDLIKAITTNNHVKRYNKQLMEVSF